MEWASQITALDEDEVEFQVSKIANDFVPIEGTMADEDFERTERLNYVSHRNRESSSTDSSSENDEDKEAEDANLTGELEQTLITQEISEKQPAVRFAKSKKARKVAVKQKKSHRKSKAFDTGEDHLRNRLQMRTEIAKQLKSMDYKVIKWCKGENF